MVVAIFQDYINLLKKESCIETYGEKWNVIAKIYRIFLYKIFSLWLIKPYKRIKLDLMANALTFQPP